MIKVETANFKQSIDAWVEKAKGRTKEFAVEVIQDLNQAVVEATPVITGHLRAQWFAGLNTPPSAGEDGGDPVARMNLVGASLKLGDVYHASNGAPYAWYVEFGTAAHSIEPKDKQALHWVSGGKDFFATHVNHPGTPPRAFVRGTLAQTPAVAEAAARKVASR